MKGKKKTKFQTQQNVLSVIGQGRRVRYSNEDQNFNQEIKNI